METVSFEHTSEDRSRRAVGDRLGTTDVAIKQYRIPPGEGLPGGVHAHEQQEEVFVVFEGTATFVTLDGPVTVDAGEAIRFAPGEFQSGKNCSADELVLLALGAPKAAGRPLFPIDCPECAADVLQLSADGQFTCTECSFTAQPAPCPECGHEELQTVVTEPPETVVRCQGCGAKFDSPPTE